MDSCKCGAHAQHRVRLFKWNNPLASYKVIAKELDLPSEDAAKQAWYRFNKKKDHGRFCPVCFNPSLLNLVCHFCGADLGEVQREDAIDFEAQNPVYSIQPLGGLGSQTSYSDLGLTNSKRILDQQISKTEKDQALAKAKRALLQFLKGFFPREDVTDVAARLLAKAFTEFRMEYPGLKITPRVANELVAITIARLKLFYPRMARGNGVTG
ncbi:MAG: hypothetical protein ACLP9K_05405 [Nitrososphaerales archaeon]